MENLDATVIVAALPTMAQAFRTDPASLSLGISGYMVAVAIFLPLSGWLADRFGARRVMALAMSGFILASIACGLATGLTDFVMARVVQGAAAALMAPAGRTSVLRDTPKSRLVHTVAILTWPALIAPIIGPPLGGFLTSHASWRWIFFLNIPVGLIGLAMIARFISPLRAPAPPPFDWRGFVLSAFALGMLVLGLEMVGASHGTSIGGAILFITGLVTAIAAVRHLRRAAHPLVDLTPLRAASLRVAALTGGNFTRIAITATPFLLPLMLQVTFGYSAFEAGALTFAYFAGNFGMKTVTTPLLRIFGFRDILIVNGLLVTATVGTFASAVLGLSPLLLALLLVLAGAVRSLQFTTLNTLAFAEVAPGQAGSANTLLGLSQQVAATTGVVIGALALQSGMAIRGSDTMAAADFAMAFCILAGTAALGTLFYARLPRTIGADVSGHRRPSA